eukprot:TRINITY_DN67176_c11_g9_i1.p1 TRINITY_DN67176_c11_g9~~TRINITY_DN67176_c11_g9_i1.p1  ORF type:complete len:310 (-),score=13.40 TRINITY_DN67176_c11_g9_i1:258-1187(-)
MGDAGKGIATAVGVLCCIGCLLLVILLPLSFQYVERNTWAFKRNSLTNDVDTDTVYEAGRYFWGVGRGTVSFPSTFQHIEFVGKEGLTVFTETGLELLLDVSFQYRLQRDNLDKLFSDFGRAYTAQIENVARASLRNEAPQFSIEQYITDRSAVVGTLHAGLARALSEIYVDVPEDKFQLRRVVLPGQVRDKFLHTFVQNEINQEKAAKAKADLIRKQTEKIEREIRGNVTIIAKRAAAKASRMVQDERAVSVRRLEVAKANGVKNVIKQLNITNQKTASTFLKYMALLDAKQPKFLAGINSALLNFGG